MSSTITKSGAQAELLPSDKPVYQTPAEVMRALMAGDIDQDHADEIIAAMIAAAQAKAGANSVKPRKTECKVTREHFADNAVALKAVLDGSPLAVDVKQFSTGSFGWHANGKTDVDVGGVKCACQYSVQLTVIGSKELPGKPEATAAE